MIQFKSNMTEITSEELERLYVQEGLKQREIAKKFGVTQSWISKKMTEYGINSRYAGCWTEREEEILKKNYKQVSKGELLSLLPDRSWEAIKLKAMDFGLTIPIEEHRRSEEVLERLRKNAQENAIEVDMSSLEDISYVIGVIDGDGFHDNKGTIGLEVKSSRFADKFAEVLDEIGLNPGRGKRRDKETVWASSKHFVDWLMDFDYGLKFEWLKDEGDLWSYTEGAYDSDGNFSNPGPRICSYDENEKRFLKKILDHLGLKTSVHSNNVYVKAVSKDEFFENVDPVHDRRKP